MTEDVTPIKVSKRFKKAQKKATRAYIKAAFFFFSLLFIEVIFPRYRDFNSVRRTTISDVFGFIDITQEIPWLSQISLLYSLIFLGLIITLPTFLRSRQLHYQPEKEKTQIQKLKRYRSRIEYVYYIAFLGFVLVFINTFLMSIAQVSGASMEPQFSDRDDVLIWHRMPAVNRGDIVVVQDPDRRNTYIVKRVIGLPNESLEIRSGGVYIEGVLLEEDYVSMGVATSCHLTEFCKVTLASDEYYLLGDNRVNSNDSRRMGLFTEDDFLGEVFFILRPFNRLGRIQP